MVEEVRRQFREIPGILEGKGTPDYGSCVEISTRAAQHEMIFPSLLAIAIPIVVGIVLGVAGVLGLLVGGLAGGFTLAVFMANAGGAWDNAKKMVEEGNFGGKGSFAHKATIVGDTKFGFWAFFYLFLKKVLKKFGGFTESLYLCTRKQETDAPVAQLVEHLTLNQGVQGSNPCGCTTREINFKVYLFFLSYFFVVSDIFITFARNNLKFKTFLLCHY